MNHHNFSFFWGKNKTHPMATSNPSGALPSSTAAKVTSVVTQRLHSTVTSVVTQRFHSTVLVAVVIAWVPVAVADAPGVREAALGFGKHRNLANFFLHGFCLQVKSQVGICVCFFLGGGQFFPK